MSENNDQDAAKGRLSLRPAGRLELGRTVDAGSVRQSFSHGRSKEVQVEVRKKRQPFAPRRQWPLRPSCPGVPRAPAAPTRPTPGGAGRALTAGELGDPAARAGGAEARRRPPRCRAPRAGEDLHPLGRRGGAPPRRGRGPGSRDRGTASRLGRGRRARSRRDAGRTKSAQSAVEALQPAVAKAPTACARGTPARSRAWNPAHPDWRRCG